MKALSKKTKANQFRQLNFGLFGAEKIRAEENLTKSEKKQKIKTLKERLKNAEYIDHAANVVADDLIDGNTKLQLRE